MQQPERQYWLNLTHVLENCDPRNEDNNFKFGMFEDAFTNEVASSRFIVKYLYCLWWGLKNLRCAPSLQSYLDSINQTLQ